MHVTLKLASISIWSRSHQIAGNTRGSRHSRAIRYKPDRIATTAQLRYPSSAAQTRTELAFVNKLQCFMLRGGENMSYHSISK